jgi:formaldehyde-activating enzyme involved in methanogenesis
MATHARRSTRPVLLSCQAGITISNMETVTLKLEKRQVQKLKARAKATGRSQAAIVRALIDEHLGGSMPSLHEQAQDLCGSVAGAADTSTRALGGYGRD